MSDNINDLMLPLFNRRSRILWNEKAAESVMETYRKRSDFFSRYSTFQSGHSRWRAQVMLPHLLEVRESLQDGVGKHNALCKNTIKTLTCKWSKSGLHSPCSGLSASMK